MKMSKGEFIQAMVDHLYDTLGEDDSQDVILEMEDSKSFGALYDFFKKFIDDGFWTI